MKKIEKGQYGYLENQTKREIVFTVILFALAFGCLIFGIIMTKTKNNLFTIAAVLGMLPACRYLINVIMFFRAKRHACPKEVYQEITQIIDGKDCPAIAYDLYMTSEKALFPIYCMASINNTLVGYTVYNKFDEEKCNEHITTMLKQNGFKNCTVKIFTGKNKFMERIKSMRDHGAVDERDLEALHLKLNLSL